MPSKWQRQEFFAGSPSAQTFTVPANVTLVYLTMVAGGGGGGRAYGAPATGAPGGGAGECCIRMPVKVTPNDIIAVAVGDAGKGGTRAAGASTDSTAGGNTTFGALRCAGGGRGVDSGGGGNQPGGNGGGAGRALGVLGGDGVIGTRAGGSVFVGGSSGGGYMNTMVAARLGGPAAGVEPTPVGINDGTKSAGGSGASSQWGVGGVGGDGGVAPADSNGRSADPTHYGAGGGGGGGYGTTPVPDNQVDGGDGAPGYVLVEWYGEV